ncbi:hypothetical protein D3C78_1911350 [compost metagenome]
MAIAKWVGALDTVKMHKALNGEVEEGEEDESEAVQSKAVSAPSIVGTSRSQFSDKKTSQP